MEIKKSSAICSLAAAAAFCLPNLAEAQMPLSNPLNPLNPANPVSPFNPQKLFSSENDGAIGNQDGMPDGEMPEALPYILGGAFGGAVLIAGGILAGFSIHDRKQERKNQARGLQIEIAKE